jgi:hypothetical protein
MILQSLFILHICKYSIIFWGNQHDVNSVFILQKKILRKMLELGYRSSCRAQFKQLAILTVPCLIHWWCLWSVIPLTLKLIFLYILYIQGRKIIFIHHWLNLHRYKGALHTLPLRYLINCHWTLLNFSVIKCSLRLHSKSIYSCFLFWWWIFSILLKLLFPSYSWVIVLNQFWYNVLSNAVYFITYLEMFQIHWSFDRYWIYEMYVCKYEWMWMWILKKIDHEGFDCICSAQNRQMVDCCENNDEHWGYVKGAELLDRLTSASFSIKTLLCVICCLFRDFTARSSIYWIIWNH